MIITYHSNLFLKLQAGDTIIAFNPISKDSKLKGAKFGADVAFVSANHEDINGSDALSFGDRVPFVVSGPGEYEVNGIFAKGFASQGGYDGEEFLNTIYSLSMDNLQVVNLGILKDEKLTDEALEAIEEVDILVIGLTPDTLSPESVYKLAVSLEPKLILPIGDEALVKQFVKEAGGEKPEVVDKLTLKKKDLEGKQNNIVLLRS